MKEIVWVFGTSASGKETFIRDLPNNEAMLHHFNWLKSAVAICESSVVNIGQFDDDPIAEQRDDILSEVPALLKTANIAVIKWQGVDMQTNRPQRLKDRMLVARHRIIELRTPEDELVERLQNKPWWHDLGNEAEYIDSELRMVAESIAQLRDNGFEVTILNSGARSHYEVIA